MSAVAYYYIGDTVIQSAWQAECNNICKELINHSHSKSSNSWIFIYKNTYVQYVCEKVVVLILNFSKKKISKY